MHLIYLLFINDIRIVIEPYTGFGSVQLRFLWRMGSPFGHFISELHGESYSHPSFSSPSMVANISSHYTNKERVCQPGLLWVLTAGRGLQWRASVLSRWVFLGRFKSVEDSEKTT